MWSDTLRPCFPQQIILILYSVIERPDSGELTRAEGRLTSTLVFLCSHSIDDVQKAGQWN